MKGTIAAIAKIETVLSLIAAAVLFTVMLTVAADVAMRYVFNHPFGWSYDLVSLYFSLAIFYFCLSRTYSAHAHVGVDILHYYVSAWTRRVFALLSCLVSAPLFAAIALVTLRRALTAFAAQDVIEGAIEWPTWAYVGLAPLGTGLLTLRLLADAVAHAIVLGGGPELIPLPPLARSDEGLDGASFE
jgi:TRAP-type C4-dicarboxylate transport system permease small subunit